MLRKRGGSFAFFITHTEKSSPASIERQMFSFPDGGGLPYVPEITLFGSMTVDECKMLAALINQKNGVRLTLPRDLDHQRFHGDTVTLSLDNLLNHLEQFVGNASQLPANAVVSMSAFFDYLRDEVYFKHKVVKNPPSPH